MSDITNLKKAIDARLNDHLCGMKPDYDDSMTGFNEAWEIVNNAFNEAAAYGADLIYPKEITPELHEVLGMMIFNSGPLAHAFRNAGHAIEKRAEDEQAFVLHWLIGLVLHHGADWKPRAADVLDGLKPISVKTA